MLYFTPKEATAILQDAKILAANKRGVYFLKKFQILTLRSLKLLLTTKRMLNAIAPAAIMGFRKSAHLQNVRIPIRELLCRNCLQSWNVRSRDVDGSIQEFQAGEYPTDRLAPLEMMDFLANSLRFKPTP